MKVSTSEMENAAVISLEGAIMIGSDANDFQAAIHSCIEKNKSIIIIDLSSLSFISSWGIGMLIHGYTTAQNRDISFKLVAVPDVINETFRKIKIDKVFQQFNTVEEALGSR